MPPKKKPTPAAPATPAEGVLTPPSPSGEPAPPPEHPAPEAEAPAEGESPADEPASEEAIAPVDPSPDPAAAPGPLVDLPALDLPPTPPEERMPLTTEAIGAFVAQSTTAMVAERFDLKLRQSAPPLDATVTGSRRVPSRTSAYTDVVAFEAGGVAFELPVHDAGLASKLLPGVAVKLTLALA